MGVSRPRPAALATWLDLSVEEWPYLDEGTLLKTRSCQGWTDDLVRQQG